MATENIILISPEPDSLLIPEEAAAWLRHNERVLLQKTRGRNPEIPAFRLGNKVLFHPRTILAVLAKRAGVPLDVVAASYGVNISKRENEQ